MQRKTLIHIAHQCNFIIDSAQGFQADGKFVIANGINLICDGDSVGAMNVVVRSKVAGESVPYLSYALAVRNCGYPANEEFFRNAA